MIKRRIQDLTVCFTYNFSCLQPQNRGRKDFRSRYRLCDEIQRGGFGIVYRAFRLSDGLPVAVKYVEHKHVREWTMNENQLIPTEICHLELCANIPGVIALVDWFASSKGFMIVMERPHHCMDLFDLTAAYGPLDEDVAKWIFTQIVDTVLEMRNLHLLVHRDIKDENVVVDMESGEVKLVDFGAADFLDSAKKKQFQGTRSYCPPEWFKQHNYLPLEATSWSLGVLLHILVNGTVPFRNEIQTCVGRLHFSADLSPECQSLIRKCLCVTPKRRITLQEIRSHQWMENPTLNYNGTFHSMLKRRAVARGHWSRRRRNSIMGYSETESEAEEIECRHRCRQNGSKDEGIGALIVPPDAIQRAQRSNLATPVEPPPVPTTSAAVPTRSPQIPERRRPRLAEIAASRRRSLDESFDIFRSVSSGAPSAYESIRSGDSVATRSESLSQSSALYFSAHESLSLADEEMAESPYERSLRSLVLEEVDEIAEEDRERTRTPSADTNTEIAVTPVPPAKTPSDEPKSPRVSRVPSVRRLLSGIRRAKSLRLPFRTQKPKDEVKKLSTTDDLPVTVVRQMASQSYDTLIALSSTMAHKASSASRLRDLVDKSPKMLRRRPTKSRVEPTTLQVETMRFPLAVFDVCAQQLPLLEQVASK